MRDFLVLLVGSMDPQDRAVLRSMRWAVLTGSGGLRDSGYASLFAETNFGIRPGRNAHLGAAS